MQITIRHEYGTIALWQAGDHLPLVNDVVVVDKRAYKVIGRNWVGPDELALVVE